MHWSGFFVCHSHFRATGEYDVCPGGGTGRRTGLKILRSVMTVRVRFPSRVQKSEWERERERSDRPLLHSDFFFILILLLIL